MTKEPADWAKIKAYRAAYLDGDWLDEKVLEGWRWLSRALHELARMYDKYEQPPVDPDLIAARGWYAEKITGLQPDLIRKGFYDGCPSIQNFLAGAKHGRANP